MKVLLVGNYAVDQQQSMLGFASTLQSGLCQKGVEVRLITPQQFVARLGQPQSGVGKWLGYIDKYGFFPREIRRAAAWADVVHICDQGNAMYIPHLRAVPHLITCHDLLAVRAAQGELPGWVTGRTGRTFQKIILNGLKQAKYITCVSETTRQDLLRLGSVPAGNTRVIYNGLFHFYDPVPGAESQPVLASLGLDTQTPYLFHVGGNQPYKNRPAVLDIFAALRRQADIGPMRLVMAGKPLPETIRRSISTQKLESVVTELPRPSNEQLRALYSRAAALVFPSLYEGFGMPVIEAQACGCPVFTSDRAPMTEVGGRAAVYFDPAQPEQAAGIIAAHLGRREEIRAAGLENVRRFTTERMIREYVQVYQDVLSRGAG